MMNNFFRRFILACAFSLCICSVATVPSVNAAATSGLQVTFTSNPAIVAPGTNGYLEVNLKSTGSTIYNVDVTAETWDSSVVQPRGNWDVSVGDLSSGDTTVVLFEFYIPTTVSPGLYQMIFYIESSDGNIRQTAILKVEDETVLDIASVNPSSISIGSPTTLFFNVTNSGAAVHDVLFTWEDPNDLILPIGSDNKIVVPDIPAHNYTEIPVDLVASPAITPGVYPLTITLEFYDGTGTKQTFTSTVGLQIGGTTDFEIILQQSSGSTTAFAIANIGANVASSVIVTVPSQPTYSVSGASSVSIGNLDAGDYTLASFQLSSSTRDNATEVPFFNRSRGEMPSGFDPSMMGGPRNQSFAGMGGDTNLIIEISYTDLFGVRQTVQKEVVLSSVASSTSDVSSLSSMRDMSGFSGQSSGGSDNGMTYIVIGAVGIIVIVAILTLGKKKNIPYISKILKGNQK